MSSPLPQHSPGTLLLPPAWEHQIIWEHSLPGRSPLCYLSSWAQQVTSFARLHPKPPGCPGQVDSPCATAATGSATRSGPAGFSHRDVSSIPVRHGRGKAALAAMGSWSSISSCIPGFFFFSLCLSLIGKSAPHFYFGNYFLIFWFIFAPDLQLTCTLPRRAGGKGNGDGVVKGEQEAEGVVVSACETQGNTILTS